jgi:hypothetical protein
LSKAPSKSISGHHVFCWDLFAPYPQRSVRLREGGHEIMPDEQDCRIRQAANADSGRAVPSGAPCLVSNPALDSGFVVPPAHHASLLHDPRSWPASSQTKINLSECAARACLRRSGSVAQRWQVPGPPLAQRVTVHVNQTCGVSVNSCGRKGRMREPGLSASDRAGLDRKLLRVVNGTVRRQGREIFALGQSLTWPYETMRAAGKCQRACSLRARSCRVCQLSPESRKSGSRRQVVFAFPWG